MVTTNSNPINTSAKRKRLHKRHEPYWFPLDRGQYLGFRKTGEPGTPTGRWIARFYGPDKKQHYSTLGTHLTIPDYTDVKARAEAYFAGAAKGIIATATVAEAMADYIEALRIDRSEDAARGAKQRLDKHVIPILGDVKLRDLTTTQIEKWHRGLAKSTGDDETIRKSKDSANRVLSYFKAGLNRAFQRGRVSSDAEWRRVKPFKKVTASRKVIFSAEQCRKLLDATSGGFHDLLRAALLTGQRYGGLVTARVSAFDAHNGTLEVSDKTGHHVVYLSDEAVRHYKKLATDKLPNAHLHLRDDGKPWGRAHQTRPMKDAIATANKKDAKIEAGGCFYSCRHTYISQAGMQGLPMQLIAENCGTSIRMIEKHYGKFFESHRREAFNKVSIL